MNSPAFYTIAYATMGVGRGAEEVLGPSLDFES